MSRVTSFIGREVLIGKNPERMRFLTPSQAKAEARGVCGVCGETPDSRCVYRACPSRKVA